MTKKRQPANIEQMMEDLDFEPNAESNSHEKNGRDKSTESDKSAESNSPFYKPSIEEFIEYLGDLFIEEYRKDSTTYLKMTCFNNPSHTCSLGVPDEGAWYVNCFHNSCHGKVSWAKLKSHLGRPPWVKRKADEGDPDEKPEVRLTTNESYVADQVIELLGGLGTESVPWLPDWKNESVQVFSRGGTLVHAIVDEDIKASENVQRLFIRDIPHCIVRERITQCCRLTIETESKEGDIVIKLSRPPRWLTDAVFNRGFYDGRVRTLTGIVESPTLRLDGSILQIPGYDSHTGLIYRPSAKFKAVPESPTANDAASAMERLLDIVADFPMTSDADKSAWLAMVLTMIGRSCIRGHAPLFAVTANIRGAGKSLLVDIASMIAYGHCAARHAFTRDDDEMRKVITALAIAATPNVLFDNLVVQLGGSSLDAAITSTTWEGRILGQSRMTGDLPLNTVWTATGNNIHFGSDTGRRVLPIRVDSPDEHPENRSDFTHKNLLGYVKNERASFAVDALTILRAFFVAGCPKQDGSQFGSFESWAERIRGAIVWAGGADPMITRESVIESDDTAMQLELLITGIESADPHDVGITSRKIIKLYEYGENEALVEAVIEICGDKPNPKLLGKRIGGLVGRVWKGRKIVCEMSRSKQRLWHVKTTI